ncbi:MAG: DNA mismatch repair protein MutS [Candidatus Omnitrophota bacterium]|nr:DNA mismatch repair protein MutS [Candidatus Omnitrophota bacterium]
MSQKTIEDPKLTPMMEQYQSIKKTLAADTVLFFRLGDFYEMFFEDAVRASEILNITLTGREGGSAGRVPMCGIPYHAFQGYVGTLLDRNLKVAICEQVGDPKASKGLVERKITRIVSPATYLEDETRGKNPDYMISVVCQKEAAALAVLELSTGEFFVREVGRERLTSELTLLAPREIICARSLSEDESLMTFFRESLNVSMTVYEDWIFEAAEGLQLLKSNFQLASEKAVGFSDRPLAVGAAGAVLYYLRDHFHAAINHIQMPSFLEADEFMILDRSAQKSLELVTTLQDKKGAGTLLASIDQSLTSMGARTLYHWVTHPLLALETIERRQTAVSELVKDVQRTHALRSLFQGVKDMERTLSRLNYGVANARDLVNLKVFLERVPEIQSLLGKSRVPALKDILGTMIPFPNLRQLIKEAVVETPPLSLKDGGLIRDRYCDDLDELREISKKGKSWILEFQQRESARTGIKNLRIKYSQVFGYTLEVSKGSLNLVPEDYTRRQTLANAERFVVPELKSWDEKITGAQDKIKALEYKLFNEIREKILEELSSLQAMSKAVGVLDALCSLAVTASQKNWVVPTLVETGELIIEGGRHPVVEAMLPAGQFVENDTYLDDADNQLIVLTGPNMAGKSTYIRQTGLLVLLAQIGSYIPAKSARIGLVDRIFTRIGASDDLARGESTFMVEMVETANILQKATNRSLLILDEVGRGTSTFDGVSIAWAICEHLAQGSVKPRTLFATHYHELTQLETHFPGIKNYNITVRETPEGIVFLRKVVRGGSDRSYGIHVACLAGIPENVTARAKKILAVLESESTEATQIIEGKKEKKQSKADEQQRSLFDWASESHPIIEEIRNLAIDGLSPLEALNKLAELKGRLKCQ